MKFGGPNLPPVALILAGGRSSRFGGGDKCLTDLGGRPLLAHIIARLGGEILLNANGDSARFAAFGLTIVPDCLPDQPGPLAGLLSGMEWLRRHRPGIDSILTVPADTPFLPRDLADRLGHARAVAGAEAAIAVSGGRRHGVIGLWPVAAAGALRHALVDQSLRRVDHWIARLNLVEIDVAADPVDPFFNINTREDLAAAERLLSDHPDLAA